MKTLILATVAAIVLAAPAFATPGAVDASGCHGHPYHCHSNISTGPTGFRFVAGHFSHHASSHRSYSRKHG